jgi:3-hydroxyisobutyrate dehydrogenase-like beta-hydroxyacid dehydrogenase
MRKAAVAPEELGLTNDEERRRVPTTVTIIAMGEMGAGIAKRLTSRGARVRTSVVGRGEESARRAAEAKVEITDDDRALLEGADFMLSIVPPATALALAKRLLPALQVVARKPIYVDCNAISPQTVQEVAAVLAPSGCGFADSGILGFVPNGETDGPRIYVSGPTATKVAGLAQFGLDMHVLDDRIGSASALKCSYAALGKGLTALASLLILGSQRAGTDDALLHELATYQPQLLAWFKRMVPDMYGKSYRWVGEMEEIARFLGATPGGGETYQGIARLYQHMAQVAGGRSKPGNEIDLLDAFLRRVAPTR